MSEQTEASLASQERALLRQEIGHIREVMRTTEAQRKVEHMDMEKKLDHITTMIDSKYVTREEFRPVKSVVYGLISLIMVAVIGSLLTLVVMGK